MGDVDHIVTEHEPTSTISPTAGVVAASFSPASPSAPLQQHGAVEAARVFGVQLTQTQTTVFVHCLLCFGQLLFGIYSVWSQYSLRFYSVELLLFSRMTSAALQIWTVSLCFDEPSRRMHDQQFAAVWGTWRELVKVWILGAFVFVVNVYMFLSAVKYTNAVVATVAVCITPVVTSVMGIALGREPFSWLQILGFALAIGGNVVQLDVWETKTNSDNYVFGVVCIVLNILSFSIFLVFSKPFMRRLPMLIVYRQMSLIGVIGTLILCLVVSPSSFSQLRTVTDPWAVGGFVYAVVVMSYVPYAIMGFSMSCNVPPPLTAAHVIFQPMFAAAIAAVALGTVLKWFQYVGGIAAVLAVSITVWNGMRRLQQAATPHT